MEPLTEAQRQLYDWLVNYIEQHQHAPSIRQMMQAMQLKSPAPVQSRLEHLRSKGYIDWTQGKARTIRLLRPRHTKATAGLPILGAIAAGGLVEPFTDAVETLDVMQVVQQPQCFALRVTGDSMIEAMIRDGDIAILQPVPDPIKLKDGTIVAALVEGEGTTLKQYFRQGRKVTLQPANSRYTPIQVSASQVQIQGSLVAVWRNYFS